MPLDLGAVPDFTPQTPQIANPLDTQAKMLQLKQLMGQQQLLPLQVQEEQEKVKQSQIATQQAQLEQKSQQAMMKAWSDPKFTSNFTGTDAAKASGVGFDPDSMTRELISRGVTPKDAFAMSSQFVERSEKIATTLKDQAQTGNDQAGIRDKGYKVLADRIAGVLDMPATKAADGLAQLKQDLVNNPQAFAGVPQEDLAHIFSADLDHLPATASLLGFDAKIADYHKSQAEAAKAQDEQNYRQVLTDLKAGKKVDPDRMARAQAYEASEAKTTTQADSLGVTSSNTSKPAGLATAGVKPAVRPAPAPGTAQSGAPSTKDSLVDAIGQYRMDPRLFSRMLTKHPDLLANVTTKYPDFDQTSYFAKNKLLAGYTSGPQSKDINAINTAMGHMKVLDDAVDALNNGDVTYLNKLGNKIGVNLTGQTAASAFKTILHRVGPEITSAYVTGGGGEKERVANEEDFSENLPPQTLHNNIATSVKLLRSKVSSLENQYKNTVQRDDFQQRFITPEAQASFDKFNPQSSGAKTPPAVGAIVKGHRFKGGNPADKNSWEKVSQ